MRIAIIGTGFSGCLLAIELMRSGPAPLDILLFDQSATFGPGVAFAARHDRLLLNTRVANMSAFATDQPAAAAPQRAAEPEPVRARAADPRQLLGGDRRARDPRAGPHARAPPRDGRRGTRRLIASPQP
jgi:2-polyprenyl-6-methoxyphenol hydroxylase-like FAD-dependent oxidoreductase